MADEGNVVDLVKFKRQKQHEQGEQAHEAGEAFRFHFFELDDGELPNGVGMAEPGDVDDAPIFILLDKFELTGICMTPETARRLGQDLIDAANEWEAASTPKEGA